MKMVSAVSACNVPTSPENDIASCALTGTPFQQSVSQCPLLEAAIGECTGLLRNPSSLVAYCYSSFLSITFACPTGWSEHQRELHRYQTNIPQTQTLSKSAARTVTGQYLIWHPGVAKAQLFAMMNTDSLYAPHAC